MQKLNAKMGEVRELILIKSNIFFDLVLSVLNATCYTCPLEGVKFANATKYVILKLLHSIDIHFF